MRLLSFLTQTLSLAATTATTAAAAALPKRQSPQRVHKFTEAAGAWAEGILARPNGQLLVSFFDAGEMWSLDPSSGTTAKVASFAGQTCTGAITEITPDVYAVVAGKFSLFGGSGNVPGSWTVYKVDMTGSSPQTDEIANIADSGMLNGITTLDEDTLLVADAQKGAVYRLSVSTGEYGIAIEDATMDPVPGAIVAMGIDGVKYMDGELFYTNVWGNGFYKVAVDETGAAAGSVETIWTDASGDDLALGADGSAYVASTSGNGQIRKYSANGQISTYARVSSPTSCTFGRGADDQSTLYVATTSGDIYAIAG